MCPFDRLMALSKVEGFVPSVVSIRFKGFNHSKTLNLGGEQETRRNNIREERPQP